MDLAKIRIESSTSDPHKGLITSVTIDGVEMADKVSAVRFEAVGRSIPTVTLDFPVGELEIVGLAHLQRTEFKDILSNKSRPGGRRGGGERKMDSKNLLEQVSNKCLVLAAGLLESKAVPTAGTVETARELIEMALSIMSPSRKNGHKK